MKVNVGLIDKLLRIGAGITLIALAAFGVIDAWGYVGVVPLLTGVVGFCPFYALFGLKTAKV